MDGDGARVFDALTGAIDYPMFVVTVAAGSERAGCLVGFTTQCSIDPPRFLVCLSRANHTFPVAQRADHLAVHALGADQRRLAALFGADTEDRIDKFAHCDWTSGPHGLPVLTDAPLWFAGPVLTRTELGDHSGFLLAPRWGARRDPIGPLMSFGSVTDLEPGHPG